MPARRGEGAVDDLEQRGFAGAIGTDDAESVAWADQPGHVVKDFAPGYGHGTCGYGIDRRRLVLVSRIGHLRGRFALPCARNRRIRVDGQLDRTGDNRLGIQRRNHVHTPGCRGDGGSIGIKPTLVILRINLRHIDQIDDLFAQSRCRHLLQFQRVAHWRHIGDEFACLFHVKLLFGRTRPRAAGQPCELLAGEIASAFLTHIGLTVTFHALQHVRAVPTFEGVDQPVVHFPHRFAHLVKEPPVVGDQQQRTLTGRPTVLQVFGKPVNRHDVKMVGRLVQREDIPVLEQQTGQIGATALAAGQRADFGVKAHASEQRLDDFTR